MKNFKDINLLPVKRKNQMNTFNENSCPNCGFWRLKTWNELTEDEKRLVEALPRNTEFTKEERKKHRFCEQCWFEIGVQETIV